MRNQGLNEPKDHSLIFTCQLQDSQSTLYDKGY